MIFQGILFNIEAANVLIAGKEQLLVLQREDPLIELDK
jgi:hypothetical protein